MNISGKICLVLGGSRGIGAAIATALAERGAHLVLPWFDWPEASQAMCQRYQSETSNHLTLQTDLRNKEEVCELVKTIKDKYGGLDVVINNVERGGMPIVHGSYNRAINQEQWQLEMETTLHAKWQVFDNCFPLLREKEEAAVINISSIAAHTGRSGPAGLLFNDGYAAANRGIQSLTETWARLGAPNIRVNEIMLGFFDTRHGPGTRGWQELSKEEKAAIVDHILLNRTGKPEEVAQAVIFLLEGGSYMTGTTIRLDGGYLLGGAQVPQMPQGVI